MKVSVAHAVAASAAYPLLFPALDQHYEFDRSGERKRERLIVTDGGVYENLGVSVFDPKREASISANVFRRKVVIVCDAGRGLPEGESHPVSWPGRMKAAFETAFRRNQTQTQSRFHQLVASGDVEGLIYAYLGQRDESLPFKPADLVSRDDVMNYPTDFSAMSETDMTRLINRGEQLVRILVPYYWSTYQEP